MSTWLSLRFQTIAICTREWVVQTASGVTKSTSPAIWQKPSACVAWIIRGVSVTQSTPPSTHYSWCNNFDFFFQLLHESHFVHIQMKHTKTMHNDSLRDTADMSTWLSQHSSSSDRCNTHCNTHAPNVTQSTQRFIWSQQHTLHHTCNKHDSINSAVHLIPATHTATHMQQTWLNRLSGSSDRSNTHCNTHATNMTQSIQRFIWSLQHTLQHTCTKRDSIDSAVHLIAATLNTHCNTHATHMTQSIQRFIWSQQHTLQHTCTKRDSVDSAVHLIAATRTAPHMQQTWLNRFSSSSDRSKQRTLQMRKN